MEQAVVATAHDCRCQGGEKDEIHVVLPFEKVEYDEEMVDVFIVFHQSYSCYEVVVFIKNTGKVWARFYFLDKKLRPLIPKSSVEHAFNTIKENHNKNYAIIDALYRKAKRTVAQGVILKALPDLINYEISRQFIVDQAETSETLHDLLGRPLEYRPYFADSISLACPKPECLVPVNTVQCDKEKVRAEYLHSEKTRKHVLFFVTGIQHWWGRKLKPLPRPDSNSVAANSIMSGQSLHSFYETEDMTCIKRIGGDGEEGGECVEIVRPLERKKSTFLALSALQRNSSFFFGKRLSVDSDAGTSRDGSDRDSSKKVSISRFRWWWAVDRVITRNVHAKVLDRLSEVETSMSMHASDTVAGTVTSDTQSSPPKDTERSVQRDRRNSSACRRDKPAGNSRRKASVSGGKRGSVVVVPTVSAETEPDLGHRLSISTIVKTKQKASAALQQVRGWKLNRTPLLSASEATAMNSEEEE